MATFQPQHGNFPAFNKIPFPMTPFSSMTFFLPMIKNLSYKKKTTLVNSEFMRSSSVMCALMLFFISSVVALQVEDGPPVVLLSFNNMDQAIDKITDLILVQGDTHDFVAVVDGKLVGIFDFALDDPALKAKRWNARNAPLGASWTEHQTAQQGTWLAPWYPASCVHQNEHGDTPIEVTLTQSMSYGRSAGAGFNFGFGHLSSMSINLETTENNSQSETRKYTVPAHSYGQVWQQQLMVWQDQQHRKCKKHHYQKGGIKCEPWSEYVRGDLPVKNGVSFGWSTGKQNMNFHSCGGGT